MNVRSKQTIWAWFSVLGLALVACNQPAELADDGFVDVTGGRIAFRVMGDGDGVPLLAIHGGPGASSCFFVETLTGIAANRPVILYDQLGSGYSDRITDLETLAVVPRFVEEVTAIRNELGLDELHILGHSWGAAVAVEYLLTADSTGVASVTLAGPLIGTERWIQDANELVARLSEESQSAIRAAVSSGDFSTEEFRAADREFGSQFGARRPLDFSREGMFACSLQPGGGSGLYGYMWGPSEFVSTGTLRDYDRTDRLHELNLPVLFLVGEYDEARPETMREFQKLVSGSQVVVIPDAAHASPWDQTEAFNASVNEFLAGVEGR